MNTIQMIEEGVVDIFIYFEGTKFIIDRLFTGSVINYRNLFLDDEPTQVYAQCMKVSFIIELHEDHLNDVIDRYVHKQNSLNRPMDVDPQKLLQKYQFAVMKEQRGYPLDYIIEVPNELINKYYIPKGLNLQSLARIVRLKNAVMRRIVEIRVMKAKPKLSVLLNELKDPRLLDEKMPVHMKEDIKKEKRKMLSRKIIELYDDSVETLSEAD